ncbi:MAG: UDP-N-acetylglucosamine 1-carboxyvinyltransferase [Deltaproteobacteria bacterium RIFCSPHIGHO2_12_FULL_43_9]|nr:MAG: UDP-N-acetylglucosamine 1-carboxyvinyltransferase [Deltaproteobacteria bacterium RIFCSPHIGHO2_12_FULL_43_9]
MQRLLIKGGVRLVGEINVSGAKNAALPLFFATLLTPGKFEITNIPRLRDIQTTVDLLKQLGAEVDYTDHSVNISTDDLKSHEAPYDLVRTMRASVLALGPLLARCGKARVSLPGGCAIGARPINLHLEGMKKLGVKISLENGYVEAAVDSLKGDTVHFSLPTVTGTENIMMLATKAEGTTIIENAAKEPEIIELQNFLNQMGAKISGAGTSKITIQGGDKLKPTKYKVMPDRIEAGTFMIAAAATGGDLIIKNAVYEHLTALITKLEECGVKIEKIKGDGLRVRAYEPLKPVNISTGPFPDFPTDCQAQMMALLTKAKGTSTIVENIFENRFMHVQELQRMGANIELRGNTALIHGNGGLTGAPVMATDLRASASLIIAGLIANGVTEVNRIYHLDRGYEKIEEKLKNVGANIDRVN